VNTPSAAAAERRAHGRVPMKRLVKITLHKSGASQTLDAWFQDLSVEGLGLVLPAPLAPGDRVGIELSMPRQTMEYVVCRCNPVPGEMYSVGCTKLQAAKKPKSESAAKPAA
jgi:PilZ domain